MGTSGRSWAEWASEIVAAEGSKPSQCEICSHDILSLYWFAVGEIQKAVRHASELERSTRREYGLTSLALAHNYGHILQNQSEQGANAEDQPVIIPQRMSERIRLACLIKSCVIDMNLHCDICEAASQDLITCESMKLSAGGAVMLPPRWLNRPTEDLFDTNWEFWSDTSSHPCASHAIKLLSLW